jgi:hypothetical protein
MAVPRETEAPFFFGGRVLRKREDKKRLQIGNEKRKVKRSITLSDAPTV